MTSKIGMNPALTSSPFTHSYEGRRMKLAKQAAALVLAVGFLVVGSPASAVPTIYFGEDTPNLPTGSIPLFPTGGAAETARNQFLSQLSGVGTEDFEGFAAGTGTPLKITFPGSSGSITACLTCGGTGVITSGYSVGRWPTSGSQYLQDSSATFGINFDGTSPTAPENTPISAFGFYGTDIGDFSGQLTVTLIDVANVATTFTIPHTQNQGNFDNSLLFWGFVDKSNSYRQINFGSTAGGVDFFGFDDMVVGDAGQIPVPATLALMGLGLAGLFARKRQETA
jgi:hypothetical protein